MRRIMITGAEGLLGQELVRYFGAQPENTQIIPLAHGKLDVTNKTQVIDALTLHQPTLLINCAVILNVDFCEENSSACYAVNRDGVKNILQAIRAHAKPLTFVQISSSEVFGRVHEGEYLINGYREDDEALPASVYQKSKKEAEDALIAFAQKHPSLLPHWFIPRAGWLYGKGRKTYVENFLEKLQKEEPLSVVKDQWRSPTWTKHFVQGLDTLIAGGYENGVYHIVSEVRPGEATTLDVIDEIRAHLGARAINKKTLLVSRNDLFKVPRAPSNVLLNTKLPRLPYWREALREYLTRDAG